VKVKDAGVDSGSSAVLLAIGYGNDEPRTVTSSTRHVIVEYLSVTSQSHAGGLMASYVTLGTYIVVVVIVVLVVVAVVVVGISCGLVEGSSGVISLNSC